MRKSFALLGTFLRLCTTGRRNMLLVCTMAFVALPAGAAPLVGAPTDPNFGCDPDIGIVCTVAFDEKGNIASSITPFGFTIFRNTISVLSIAPTVNPAFVDSLGNPVQVTSYLIGVSVFGGAIGLCEFGVTASGSACIGPAGDVKSDVVIFTNLRRQSGLSGQPGYDPGLTRIDFLSDNEDPAFVLTDFNVLEVGNEGNNGAVYGSGISPRFEQITYNIISDAVPEPATLALLGLGGLAFLRRKR